MTDANGRPSSFFVTAGHVSDYTGAAALLDHVPKAQWLLGDCGYDADWVRDALLAKGIEPCIPGRRWRNERVRYDKRRFRPRVATSTTAARLSSFEPSPSLPASSSGGGQRVLTIAKALWLGISAKGALRHTCEAQPAGCDGSVGFVGALGGCNLRLVTWVVCPAASSPRT